MFSRGSKYPAFLEPETLNFGCLDPLGFSEAFYFTASRGIDKTNTQNRASFPTRLTSKPDGHRHLPAPQPSPQPTKVSLPPKLVSHLGSREDFGHLNSTKQNVDLRNEDFHNKGPPRK